MRRAHTLRPRTHSERGRAMSDANTLDAVGIGSMVLDQIYRCPRVLRADEKAILRPLEGGAMMRRAVGGVVLNHLGWAATLGLRVGIFGKQADDETGRFLRAAMDRFGIARNLILDGTASSFAEIFVDDAGGRAIYMAPGATSETTADHVRRHHEAFVRRARFVTTEVSQLPLEAVLEAQRLAREAGVPCIVDLDVPPSDAVPGLGDEAALHAVLRGAHLLKPAKAAAHELVGGRGDDALSLARAVRALFGVDAVVLTDGEAGCAIAATQFEGCVPAPTVKAIDTTGAGDAFLGGLLAAQRFGLPWIDAGRLANACGAACVEQLGAFPEDAERARARVRELFGPGLELPPMTSTLHAGGATADTARSGDAGGGAEALAVLDIASSELAQLRARSRAEDYERAAQLIRDAGARSGRLHVTGVGKASHVAHYGAALLSSVGTPAGYYDAHESVHGSSGQLVRGDVLIAISHSGETEELQRAIEVARSHGAHVIGITGGATSWLARHADAVLDSGVAREGGPLGLAPRASVAAQSMVIAGLAALLEHASGFTAADYLARHPAGALAQRAQALVATTAGKRASEDADQD